jgi:outer membrane protein OmpA-like peptidoglycan-associated protein
MQIIGHADRRPHTATNHALGLERARAVARLLVDLGIPGSWLRVTSEGALRPARGVEKTDDDRLRDRRVEIVLGGETSPVEEVSLVVP